MVDHSSHIESSDALFTSAILSFFYAFLTFGELYEDYGEQQHGSSETPTSLVPIG